MALMAPIMPKNFEGSDGHLNSSALYPAHRVSCLRNSGSRSLDNLCSPEVAEGIENNYGGGKMFEKSSIGSSTPALNHDTMKENGEEFWEFKVPEAPKKPEMRRAEQWAESIEKLLADPTGTEVFTEFLEHEFSAENIHFYTACLKYKESYADLTPSQKISMASTIFQRHLQNGATDPINVDHQARHQVEKTLPQPMLEMFDLPLAQVFNLLKFDCYPRFLRSEVYRDYLNGTVSVSQSLGEVTDSDADSVKSESRLHSDGRRRSLLPWNIRNRSKNKNRKNEVGLNSDISFIQKTALAQNSEGSDLDEDLRRQSYKLCRVVLPDKSTTVLACKPGESLSTVVQRLLGKREFSYSAFEVFSVPSGKPMDLSMEASSINVREIKVEPRAFIEIALPLGWRVGIRANPQRKMTEVLKPILTQHSLKLDNITICDLDTGELIDLKCQVGKLDGHNISVQMKGDAKLDEVNGQTEEFQPAENYPFDEDQLSTKTSSSQASSVFREFLRRSSKKYRKEKLKFNQPSSAVSSSKECLKQEKPPQTLPIEPTKISKAGDMVVVSKYASKCHSPGTSVSQATILLVPPTSVAPKLGSTANANNSSPLSLIPSELNLVENSRNRKPIYINQSVELSKS